MKSVIITGSSRGIGYGMANEFLKRGHQVTVSGQSEASTTEAVQKLSELYPHQQILGQACNVSSYEQVRNLWESSVKRFGKVDIWINNAGLSNSRLPFWEQPPAKLETVVKTNILGLMHGSKVAMEGMLKQGFGQLYNMEGLGSSGSVMAGLILYGTTKNALTYLTKGLIKEAKETPVQVCYLSPGMVLTDLLETGLTSTADVERTKRVYNILADKVETVTPYLVERMLENNKHGARIAWLTTPKVIWRFATSRFNKRDFFAPALA